MTYKIKEEFFQAVDVSVLMYGCTTWTLTKTHREKALWELHKNAAYCFEQIPKAVLHKQQLYGH